jgi:hypothetical protein
MTPLQGIELGFALGVATVVLVIVPCLRMLQFEGFVLPRRKAGSR